MAPSRPRTSSPEPDTPTAVGVAGRALIADEDGCVLLLRRAPTAALDPGCWEPPGGKAEVGEALADALVREVREETGLQVRLGRPVDVRHYTAGSFWVTSVAYTCVDATGEVSLSPEHDRHAWVRPDDVDRYALARGVAGHLEAYRVLRRSAQDVP